MTTVADLSCIMRTITKIFTLTLKWEAGRPFIRYIKNIDNSNNKDAHCPLKAPLFSQPLAQEIGWDTQPTWRGPCSSLRRQCRQSQLLAE